MVALLGFLGTVFSSFVANTVVRFIAYKALLLFLFVFILPAVLFKLFFIIKLYMLDLVMTILESELLGGFNLGAGMIHITGIAAYIGLHLKLVEGVSVLVSCALSGWIVRMVRG